MFSRVFFFYNTRPIADRETMLLGQIAGRRRRRRRERLRGVIADRNATAARPLPPVATRRVLLRRERVRVSDMRECVFMQRVHGVCVRLYYMTALVCVCVYVNTLVYVSVCVCMVNESVNLRVCVCA